MSMSIKKCHFLGTNQNQNCGQGNIPMTDGQILSTWLTSCHSIWPQNRLNSPCSHSPPAQCPVPSAPIRPLTSFCPPPSPLTSTLSTVTAWTDERYSSYITIPIQQNINGKCQSQASRFSYKSGYSQLVQRRLNVDA